MSFYSLISSHLSLCASLFLFYFGFMSCLLFVWKGWCDPRTGNAVELLIYHRFVLFSCWFRCTELFILHFSEFEKISCNFLSNWAAFACLEPCCFPEAQSQPAEGVLPPAEPPVPAQRPKLPVHERGVRNPALHPEVHQGKALSVPCGICPLTSLTFSCLKHRLCDSFPTVPCHCKGHSWESTALFCILVWLALDPNQRAKW